MSTVRVHTAATVDEFSAPASKVEQVRQAMRDGEEGTISVTLLAGGGRHIAIQHIVALDILED